MASFMTLLLEGGEPSSVIPVSGFSPLAVTPHSILPDMSMTNRRLGLEPSVRNTSVSSALVTAWKLSRDIASVVLKAYFVGLFLIVRDLYFLLFVERIYKLLYLLGVGTSFPIPTLCLSLRPLIFFCCLVT